MGLEQPQGQDAVVDVVVGLGPRDRPATAGRSVVRNRRAGDRRNVVA